MDTKIIEKLKAEFQYVGEEKISGFTALKIIEDTIKSFENTEESKEFMDECSECCIGFPMHSYYCSHRPDDKSKRMGD